MAQEKQREKVVPRREKGALHKRSKRSKTTKKKSWVDKDLTKGSKKSVLKRTELCRMLKGTETLKTVWKNS